MEMHGIIQSAQLQENPPGSDRIEMVLRVQGVGAGQPRVIVVPFELLVADPTLDPEAIEGRGFAAEAEEVAAGRWVIQSLTVAQQRVLRDKPP